ncbi:MAG: Gfo/Idh/MocA family oxidoreductase [Phycisphaerales bacterium]
MARKVRMGMVGGGRGAFIGAVHRTAARLDDRVELVCAALSADPERARASAQDINLPDDRAYASYQEMFEREATLPVSERMEFVAIVTPNHVHHPVARAALEHGFHVLSDKPATLTLAEARDLAVLIGHTGLLYALTHNYTGYPMIKHARDLLASGELGKVRKVVAEYSQGWLATPLERSDHKQAAWRTDPARAGAGGCLGDIGSHAHNLAEYVTALDVAEVAADLTAFVEGRPLDDDVNILLRFNNGAKGVLHASQIAVGAENDLSLRVYTERGGLEWRQTDANTLLVHRLDQPTQTLRTAHAYLSDAARAAARIPPGHPEGYLEAFANIYTAFAADVLARADDIPAPATHDYPGIDDAIRGMAFIEAAVASSNNNAAWTPVVTA